MRPRSVLFAISCVVALAPRAIAADDATRWGVTVWGVSYHVDHSTDYQENNWGAGLRYYAARHLFVEGDALRNSNGGMVLPVSVGGELPIAGVPGGCKVAVVGALTVAYYQNLRTNTDYVKWGPVPGVAVRCGRVQPNVVAVLSPSSKLLTALAASVTVHF